MTATTQDFTIYQGDAAQPVFTVIDDAGDPINLSTVSDIFWVAQRTEASAAVITKQLSTLIPGIEFVTDGTDGQFRVLLDGTDTVSLSGYYIHEAYLIDSMSNQSTVSTGRLRVGRLPDWTYSGDPATSKSDAVRFLVGDTNPTEPQLQDGEVAFCVAQRSTVYGAAAMACLQIATGYSRQADSVQGPTRTLYSSRARAYAARAAQYESLAAARGGGMPYAGGISVSDKIRVETDSDRVRPAFNVEMDEARLPVAPVGNELPDAPSGTGTI